MRVLEVVSEPDDIARAIVGHHGNLRKFRARGRFLDLLRPYVEREPAAPV